MARSLAFAAMVLLTCAGGAARAQLADGNCGDPFVNNYGPYDYRTDRGPKLKIVEDYHFSPRVESLVGGQSGSIEADLAYTLRAFPNHHRALISMKNLAPRLKAMKRAPDAMPAECYFLRALRFRPDDTIARLIYAQFLAASARKPDAVRQLDQAIAAAKDNAFSHYNIGLVYLEIGEPDKALAQAHRSIALGLDRPELKQRLQAINRWTDPPPAAAPEGAASEPAEGAASAASGG